MTDNKQTLTQEGYDQLVAEITERETVIRDKIADDIERAREQGDLSENAAYKAALEAKELNENQISKLKEILVTSEVMKKVNNGKVGLGSKVTLERKSDGQPIVYQIVGNNEADPASRKISLDSPIGSSLEGRSEGESITVETPGGTMEFIIKSIS